MAAGEVTASAVQVQQYVHVCLHVALLTPTGSTTVRVQVQAVLLFSEPSFGRVDIYLSDLVQTSAIPPSSVYSPTVLYPLASPSAPSSPTFDLVSRVDRIHASECVPVTPRSLRSRWESSGQGTSRKDGALAYDVVYAQRWRSRTLLQGLVGSLACAKSRATEQRRCRQQTSRLGGR